MATQRHYSANDLARKLDQALYEAGLGEGTVEWPALASIDQFHAGGLDATKNINAKIPFFPHEGGGDEDG